MNAASVVALVAAATFGLAAPASGSGAPASAPMSPPASAPSGAPAAGDGTIVHVAAATSLRDALTTVAAIYQKLHPGSQVRPIFGASNQLARQIVAGAPVDVFLSADSRSMDAVEKAGKLVPATRVVLLTNSLAVVVPPGPRPKVETIDDLASSEVAKIALCDDAVPIGHYARAWLASKGILSKLDGRIVRPDDARATLAMVEIGAVDAGFVYLTDARAAKRAKLAFEIPPGETPGIAYPVAIVRDGPDPRGGREVYEFIRMPSVGYFFRIAGFGLVEGPPEAPPAGR